MKAKPVVMLLFSAALVGGFFLYSRKASAATAGSAAGAADKSFLDGLLESFGLAGGEVGGAAGAQGFVPFSEVTQGAPTFPGGGTKPLAFEGTIGPSGPQPKGKPPKAAPVPLPTAPTSLPRAFEGGAGSRVREIMGAFTGTKTPTLAPGRSTPVAPKIPRAAPVPRPAPLNRALGASGRIAGKDSRLVAIR